MEDCKKSLNLCQMVRGKGGRQCEMTSSKNLGSFSLMVHERQRKLGPDCSDRQEGGFESEAIYSQRNGGESRSVDSA